MLPPKTLRYVAPDATGHFGPYGGSFIPEILVPTFEALRSAWNEAKNDSAFWNEWRSVLNEYVGRPTPLTFAERLSEQTGLKVYLKREDLCHTGAHKVNNTVGQVLLARRMGRNRIIAETGAGQHGVATATVCAKYGLPCVVYMGEEDMRRQELNVLRMRLLGAEVVPATSGSKTLKDATNEAFRDWVAHPDDTFYVIGSVVGPHPYPEMVRDLQRIIGDEVRQQLAVREGRETPDAAFACVGGGSNAMGLFYPFVNNWGTLLFGAEAAGEGLGGRHAATLTLGTPGVLHGSMSYLLQDAAGQVQEAHSISAGLDYPGVGPEHAYLRDLGRVRYEAVTDDEALAAVQTLSRLEGIIPALESAHAVALLLRTAPSLDAGSVVVLNVSGRGDKDMHTLSERWGNG